MTGFCAHCGTETFILRYRLEHVGLRYLAPACAERLRAMGMDVQAVTVEDPRHADVPVVAERRVSLRRLLLGAA